MAHGAQDGVTYEFRARGSDKVDNHQAWTGAQTYTTVYLTPYSTITYTDPAPMLQIKSGPSVGDSFQVFWEGHTAPGTTPLTYDVQYKTPNTDWTAWPAATGTLNTSATFELDVNDPDGIYSFEVRARNNLGQQEPFTGTAEGSIIVDRHAPFLEPMAYMPIVFNQ